ncbi:hypothetical protein ABTF76_22260, partial [Acinetobacter baumannii]
CGIHSFYRPRSHPTGIDVNLNCLDGEGKSEILKRLDGHRVFFDGKNWEHNIQKINQNYEEERKGEPEKETSQHDEK